MSMTIEQELAFLKMQQQLSAQQQQQGGAITGQGIRAWWAVIAFLIMGLVGFCVWLAGNSSKATEEFVNIKRDISELKVTRDSIVQVKADQQKTSTEVSELRMTVKSIEAGQADLAKRMESVGSDLRALSSQVNSISQALRGR